MVRQLQRRTNGDVAAVCARGMEVCRVVGRAHLSKDEKE